MEGFNNYVIFINIKIKYHKYKYVSYLKANCSTFVFYFKQKSVQEEKAVSLGPGGH